MKLVSYEIHGEKHCGILKEDAIERLASCDMNEIICDNNQLKCVTGEDSLKDCRILAPIDHPLQDVICLGLNYAEHEKEAAAYSAEAFKTEEKYPVYFSKRVNHFAADGEVISSHSDLTQKLDYEAELAVIIGKDAYRVSEEDSMNYVFGYTILNDISARDVQTRHKQWYFGKSLDGFTPLGPCIVTRDEFAELPALKIQSYVNGELRQNSSTDMLIFSIPYIIHELSQGMMLQAGTIISTGTPKGTAMGMDHPVFLKEHDQVTCVIEGIGSLTTVIGGNF